MMLPIDKRNELVERLADLLERKGMTAPAVLFLEANKPLSFVASQTLLMLEPFLSLALGREMTKDLALLLEDRTNVDLLISRLDRGRTEEQCQP